VPFLALYASSAELIFSVAPLDDDLLLLQDTALAAQVCGRLAAKLKNYPADSVISPALGGRSQALDQQGLAYDFGGGKARIHGGSGILKNHLYIRPEGPQLSRAEARQIAAGKKNLAFIRALDPADAARHGGFSAS